MLQRLQCQRFPWEYFRVRMCIIEFKLTYYSMAVLKSCLATHFVFGFPKSLIYYKQV